ncbi:hypothetical protein AN643_04285 [Candidatus Epulonipiscioides saccharophilum]|nr:hypothetical protein AN643_04285 [Epulopiscium sp. SCG-B10WGA-EpuloB]
MLSSNAINVFILHLAEWNMSVKKISRRKNRLILYICLIKWWNGTEVQKNKPRKKSAYTLYIFN